MVATSKYMGHLIQDSFCDDEYSTVNWIEKKNKCL